MEFNPGVLRDLRRARGISASSMASRLAMSPTQLHRLESGSRRLTVDALLAYCRAIDVDVSDVLTREVLVPIVGVMTADAEVLPLPPGSAHQTPAPRIVPDPARLAAIRWEPSGRVAAMRGHLYFFVANTNGVDERAWGQRSIIGRANGTQRVGWPKRDGNRVYIEYIERQVEFDVEIAWANPILAVVSPVAWAYQLTDRAPRD